MSNSRKYLAGLASAGFVMAIAVPSQAFTGIAVSTLTATVTVGGGATSMTVALLNTSGAVVTGPITWTANVGNGWLAANEHLQITSQMSQSNGAFIQTYTANTAATATPRYTGIVDATHQSPSGLINSVNTAAAPLPTAWQVSTGTAVAPDDPNCNGAATQPAFCTAGGHVPTGYAWFYHEDKGQVANNQGVTGPFVNGAPYVEMETAGVPPNIQFAQGSFGAGAASGINEVFLEANFANATGGATYGTNTLTVELATP